jgi:WASH complex subunit 7, N-terminal
MKAVFASRTPSGIQIPTVYLCGNVSWTASRFFVEKMPQLMRLLDKKAIQQVDQQRLLYLQTKEASLIR